MMCMAALPPPWPSPPEATVLPLASSCSRLPLLLASEARLCKTQQLSGLLKTCRSETMCMAVLSLPLPSPPEAAVLLLLFSQPLLLASEAGLHTGHQLSDRLKICRSEEEDDVCGCLASTLAFPSRGSSAPTGSQLLTPAVAAHFQGLPELSTAVVKIQCGA